MASASEVAQLQDLAVTIVLRCSTYEARSVASTATCWCARWMGIKATSTRWCCLILLSAKGPGFLREPNLLCVALSRAKHVRYIIGNVDWLEDNRNCRGARHIRSIVNYHKTRRSFYNPSAEVVSQYINTDREFLLDPPEAIRGHATHG